MLQHGIQNAEMQKSFCDVITSVLYYTRRYMSSGSFAIKSVILTQVDQLKLTLCPLIQVPHQCEIPLEFKW